MVSVRSMLASGSSTPELLASLDTQLQAAPIDPHFAFAFYGHRVDDAALHRFLTDRLPRAAVLGGTSCAGVMSDAGLGDPVSIGLLLLEDPDGSYGAAATRLGADPAADAEATLHAALEAADSPGELPELVWVYQAPGSEEDVVEGLRRVVGDRCPIVGGSSADDHVAGLWRQLGPDGPLTGGLVVGVLFSSGGIATAFQGGYEPTGAHGVVTELGYGPGDSGVVTAGSGRHVAEIDGEPAAQVYDRWTGGAVLPRDVLRDGGNVLAATTMQPLAVGAGHIDEVTHFRLIHPDAVTPDGGLTTFARVQRGDRIYAMRGDRDRLVQRVGRVAGAAVSSLPGGSGSLAGGLVVYCGGCRLAVGDRVDDVCRTARDAFDGAPFVGCFTFGEQGVILDRSVHANLMISAIAFGR